MKAGTHGSENLFPRMASRFFSVGFVKPPFDLCMPNPVSGFRELTNSRSGSPQIGKPHL
jgi:hypothetical protein